MNDWLIINNMKRTVTVTRRPNGLHSYLALQYWRNKGYEVYFSF